MKSKQIITVIGVLALLILAGIFFAYYSIHSENSFGIKKSPFAKSTYNQNRNEANWSDSKPVLNKKRTSNRQELDNARRNIKVVDQTLRNVNLDKFNSVSSRDEIIEIEIILYDSESNKLLKNYDVEIKCSGGDDDPPEIAECKTNSNGKLLYHSKAKYQELYLFTKDYTVCTLKNLQLIHGNRHFEARLYKGVSILIKATDINNKVIEKLEVIFNKNIQLYDHIPLEFNGTEYLLKNVPVGYFDLSFNANGYIESPIYRIKVEPKILNKLEIKLALYRKIQIDLDVFPKPEFIFCTERTSFAVAENGNYLNVLNEYISKNKNNYYEYLLSNNKFDSLVIMTKGYIPKLLSIQPEVNLYKVSLEKSFRGELKVLNEKNEPIKDLTIEYYEPGKTFFLNDHSELYI